MEISPFGFFREFRSSSENGRYPRKKGNNMEKTASFKTFISALAIGLFGALAGAFSPALLVLAAAGTVYLGIRHGKFYAGVPFFFTLLGILFSYLGDDITMYSLWGAFTLFCMFTYRALKKQIPYRSISLVLAVFALIALYIGFGLPSLLAGKAPYDAMLESLRELDDYYRSAGVIVEDIATIRASIPYTFYGMLVVLAEAAALFTVFFSHKFLNAAKANVRPMARLREWQLPQSLKLGIPVFAVVIIIMYLAGMNAAPVVLYTVLYMLMPPLLVCGVATALYLAARGRERVPVPIVLFIALITVFSPYFMALLGAIDLYAGIRRKLIRTDRLIKEAFEKANREKSNTVTVDFGDGSGPRVIAVRKKKEAFFDHVIDDDGDNSDGSDDDERIGEDERDDTDKENNDGGDT